MIYGVQKLLVPHKFPYGIVVGLHRVTQMEEAHLSCNESLKITPESLEKFIKTAKQNGFNFVSIDELITMHHNPSGRNKKVLAITLDDAYLDNYINAIPIFKRYHIPYCIFTAPGLIDDPTNAWWFLLENYILRHNKIEFDNNTYICKSKDEKESTFWHIRNSFIIKQDMTTLRQILSPVLDIYSTDNVSCVKQMFMSWSQLEEISQDSLCTIGSHTYHHISFNGCNNWDTINSDLEKCQKSILSHIGISPVYFAYPYGDIANVKPVHREWMHKQFFQAVFLAQQGTVGCTSNLLDLPRYFIDERSSIDIVRAMNRLMFRPQK